MSVEQMEVVVKMQEAKAAEVRAKYVVYGDGFADITLQKGVSLGGAVTKALRMREPTVLDSRTAVATSKGAQDQMEVTMFANLCDVLPVDIDGMTARDYGRLQAAYTGFTD